MFHLPVGKRVAAGIPGRKNQFAHALAPAVEALEQALERVPVSGVPLRRNLRGLFAEDALGDPIFEAVKPGLECLHAGDTLVDSVARVQAAQRSIGEIPLPGVEAESEVDHHCCIAHCCVARRCITRRRVTRCHGARRCVSHPCILRRCGTARFPAPARVAEKNRLAPVRVAGPFVEDKNAEEIRKISHCSQLLVGQKIVNRHPGRMSRELRSKLFSRRAGFSSEAQLDHEVRRIRDDFWAHLDHFDLRHAQSQPRRQTCCKHFVRQNPQMLWIVLEFDDVVRLIVAAHQLGLRAAPHPPHMLDGQLHAAMLVTHGRSRKKIVPRRETRITGREIYLVCTRMKQELALRQNKPKARRKHSGPQSANRRSANLFGSKRVSAFCRAWPPSSRVFSWPLFWERAWPSFSLSWGLVSFCSWP